MCIRDSITTECESLPLTVFRLLTTNRILTYLIWLPIQRTDVITIPNKHLSRAPEILAMNLWKMTVTVCWSAGTVPSLKLTTHPKRFEFASGRTTLKRRPMRIHCREQDRPMEPVIHVRVSWEYKCLKYTTGGGGGVRGGGGVTGLKKDWNWNWDSLESGFRTK